MGEQIDVDIPNCPECGALSNDGLTCRERFHALLAMEGQDVALADIHLLMAVCYNLQHPSRFSLEGVNELRSALAGLLDSSLSVEEIKRRASAEYNDPKKVLQPAWGLPLILRLWDMTIADVYHPFQVQGTAERVKQWAESIRCED